MTTQIYTHKRGATLSLAGTVTLPEGTWTGASQVRQLAADGSLTLVEPLTVTVTAIDPAPAAGEPTHTVLVEGSAAMAADWPLGRLLCDVTFTDDSATPVVIASETFVIKVTQEVTSAAA